MPPVPKGKREVQSTASRDPRAPASSRDPRDPASSRDSQDPASLDDIEIRLAFDLGEKMLRLGELAALQPGQVLALDTPPSRLVAIRANGHLIGRGELVRVDERVAVRVLELAGPGSPRSLS